MRDSVEFLWKSLPKSIGVAKFLSPDAELNNQGSKPNNESDRLCHDADD